MTLPPPAAEAVAGRRSPPAIVVAGVPGGHVIVAAVAVDAGHLAGGVLRAPPAAALGAVVLFVATEAGFRPRHRVARLEAEDQPRFPALRFQVAAGRPVTALARVAAMHVLGKRLGVGLVAGRAQLVIVDVFRALHRRQRALDLLIGDLGEEGVASGPAGIEIRLRAPPTDGAIGRRPPPSTVAPRPELPQYNPRRGSPDASRCPQLYLRAITGHSIVVDAATSGTGGSPSLLNFVFATIRNPRFSGKCATFVVCVRRHPFDPY